jgi:hypothetical protein
VGGGGGGGGWWWYMLEYIPIRKDRKVRRVMGWALSRQLSWPGVGGGVEVEVEVLVLVVLGLMSAMLLLFGDRRGVGVVVDTPNVYMHPRKGIVL